MRNVRKRLQIELGPTEALAFERIRALGVNDAEVGRRAISLLARLAEAVEDGFTIVAVSPEESRFVDVAPELTTAVAPERRYKHLVKVPHPWRRQLSFKGRRLTVGQFVSQMTADGLGIEEAADAFDLSPEAVAEALDYSTRNLALLNSEGAEERRRVEMAVASARR
jgi:uncharacterized protein (DUF433 family)